MLGFRGRNNRNEAQPSLESYAGTVEQILPAVGIDPVAARMQTDEGYGWTFKRGSATIEVFVAQQENTGYLQVLSPIMHLPSSGLLPLYRHLLELNLGLTNATLGVYQDVVYVFSERPLQGMDAGEANTIIQLVGDYADDLDDKLVAEFGGRRYNQI